MDEQKRAITEAVAARMKYLRKIRNISQEELALRAGINTAYYGQVERGLKCPTVDTMFRVAKAMQVSPAEFLRTDALAQYPEDEERQMKEIVDRVPQQKRGAFLKAVGELAALFDEDEKQ